MHLHDLEHSRGSPGSPGASQSGVIGCNSGPPSTRAGGQDDVSLSKLPQKIKEDLRGMYEEMINPNTRSIKYVHMYVIVCIY